MGRRRDAAMLCIALGLVATGWPAPAATGDDPGGTPGAVIRRCVSADGAVRYQSTGCGDGESESWQRPLDADAPPAAASATPPSPPARRPRATRRAPAPSAAARAHAAARARCAQVRREADARRDRDWNRLGFRARSELDAQVAQACGR